MSPKIPLVIKQADTDQRNTQVRCALEVIAGEDAQSARVYRKRLVQPEFGREIGHWTRSKNTRMPRSPGSVSPEILPLAAVGIVNPAVQHQLSRATLDLRQGNLCQKRDGVVLDLPPAYRIEVEEQARRIVIPTPPPRLGVR